MTRPLSYNLESIIFTLMYIIMIFLSHIFVSFISLYVLVIAMLIQNFFFIIAVVFFETVLHSTLCSSVSIKSLSEFVRIK